MCIPSPQGRRDAYFYHFEAIEEFKEENHLKIWSCFDFSFHNGLRTGRVRLNSFL